VQARTHLIPISKTNTTAQQENTSSQQSMEDLMDLLPPSS